jgi:hypothetical protein
VRDYVAFVGGVPACLRGLARRVGIAFEAGKRAAQLGDDPLATSARGVGLRDEREALLRAPGGPIRGFRGLVAGRLAGHDGPPVG